MSSKLFFHLNKNNITNLVIIECGTPAVIANSLLVRSGCSKILSSAHVLSSKESQNNYLGNSNYSRSVSEEFIRALLDKHTNIIATSFQLEEDAKKHTHGWIGIKLNGYDFVYHLEINITTPCSKEKLSEYILENVADSVQSILSGGIPVNSIAVYKNGVFNLQSTLDSLETACVIDENSFLTERVESFFRDKEGIVIFRGSFNPIHTGHLSMIDEVKKAYPNYGIGLYISINNFDKPSITSSEIYERVENISKKNPSCNDIKIIIGKDAYFNSLNKVFKRFNKNIVLLLGADTFNRLETPFIMNENFSIFVCERIGFPLKELETNLKIEISKEYKDSGISSTKIREVKKLCDIQREPKIC